LKSSKRSFGETVVGLGLGTVICGFIVKPAKMAEISPLFFFVGGILVLLGAFFVSHERRNAKPKGADGRK
jgi:hypothetical protein